MPVYKDEKRKTWYFQFSIKNKEGNFSTVKRRGFSTKKEALMAEIELRESFSTASQDTVGEMMQSYLDSRKLHIKESTFATKLSCVNRYILPYLANTIINQLTPSAILNWQYKLLERKCSDFTVKYAFSVLSAGFNFYCQTRGLKANPIKKAECITTPFHKRFNFWSLGEFHQFMKWANEQPQTDSFAFYILLIEILFYTGMRWGELQALTLGDFDFEKQTVTISKSKNKYGIITSPKTSTSNRTLKLSHFLVADIIAYINKLFNPGKTDLIFTTSNKNVREIIKKASKETGLPYLRIHDLRHSNASLLASLQYSPLMIKKRLGHQSISTTLDIYTNMYKEDEKRLVTEMDCLLNNISSNLLRYPLCLYAVRGGYRASFPDFPDIPAFEASSIDEIYSKGSLELKNYIGLFRPVFHVTDANKFNATPADVIVYITVPITWLTRIVR